MRLVEDVEGLDPDLHFPVAPGAVEPEAFEQAEVRVEDSRADQDIASGIPNVERHRRDERRRIEPSIRGTFSTRQVALPDPIGARMPGLRRIEAERRRERRAAAR